MANFQTHLTASTILGVGYGGVAALAFGVPLPAAGLAAGLCSVSGMLPDIDSGPGRPVHEITTFMASVIPTILFGRLLNLGLSVDTIILIGAAIYALIRFGLTDVLHHYTVHRGMFHSFPALGAFALLTYLLFYGDEQHLRVMMAGGVAAGFFSHLLLDEIYAVQWDGAPRLKRSFGTAMKFVGEDWWPNASAWGKFLILGLAAWQDPGVIGDLQAGKANQIVDGIAHNLNFNRMLNQPGTAPLAGGQPTATSPQPAPFAAANGGAATTRSATPSGYGQPPNAPAFGSAGYGTNPAQPGYGQGTAAANYGQNPYGQANYAPPAANYGRPNNATGYSSSAYAAPPPAYSPPAPASYPQAGGNAYSQGGSHPSTSLTPVPATTWQSNNAGWPTQPGSTNGYAR